MLNLIFHFYVKFWKRFSAVLKRAKCNHMRKNFAMLFRPYWRKNTIRLCICSSLYRRILAAMARYHGGMISWIRTIKRDGVLHTDTFARSGIRTCETDIKSRVSDEAQKVLHATRINKQLSRYPYLYVRIFWKRNIWIIRNLHMWSAKPSNA